MEHIKSSFFFKSKEDTWRVDYQDKPNEEGRFRLTCQVYLNDEIYHDFEGRLPNTNTSNPTKSQAKEIISAAKKINKVTDKREKKLKKILDN
jgi:hypothetical protein